MINESALYRAVGGVDVMREQLSTLLERAELPNVNLRILPFEAGAHKDQDIDLSPQIFQRIHGQALHREESVKRIQRVRDERFEG